MLLEPVQPKSIENSASPAQCQTYFTTNGKLHSSNFPSKHGSWYQKLYAELYLLQPGILAVTVISWQHMTPIWWTRTETLNCILEIYSQKHYCYLDWMKYIIHSQKASLIIELQESKNLPMSGSHGWTQEWIVIVSVNGFQLSTSACSFGYMNCSRIFPVIHSSRRGSHVSRSTNIGSGYRTFHDLQGSNKAISICVNNLFL